MVKKLIDGMLGAFLPKTQAHAIDCWEDYWCDRDSQGSVYYHRTCCLTRDGVHCNNWYGVCTNCC
ncbi:hypothetical protein [Nonomuraea sp. NPDC049141]|uniref:hypothetical protein n=1 Tax=unclassified Nonomuraea TaxID=2593643 RepID=UPI0033DA6F2A